ncbi:MAG: hypothetical protein HRT57_14005 [Crocinitomicaceae bacterium]|nr:hypothetical protein [Crocinitomicaceae bacterium]
MRTSVRPESFARKHGAQRNNPPLSAFSYAKSAKRGDPTQEEQEFTSIIGINEKSAEVYG